MLKSGCSMDAFEFEYDFVHPSAIADKLRDAFLQYAMAWLTP